MTVKHSTGIRNMMLGLKRAIPVANGSFTSATSSWTAVTANLSSDAGGQSGNCLTVASSGANAGQAYQDITGLVAGRRYEAWVYFKKGTSDTGAIRVGTSGNASLYAAVGGLADATWTLYKVPFTPLGTTARITMESSDATDTETSLFDEVALYDIRQGFREIMEKPVLEIYTGSQPANADAAETGTKLVSIVYQGSDPSWGDPSGGVVSASTTALWSGTGLATGTAGWYRLREADDTGGASTVFARQDGTCGTSGSDLNMASLTVVSGAVVTISTSTTTLPA